MSSFSQGFRSFLAGFDWELIRDYWRAVREHAWEIFWGSGVLGIIFTAYTLYYAPARAYIPWAVAWAILVAGYYTWRADHIRLVPKFTATEFVRNDARTADGHYSSYFQIVPRCLSAANIENCIGLLTRIEAHSATMDKWQITESEVLPLQWSFGGDTTAHLPITLYAGAENAT